MVEATEVTINLLPAVIRTKFPLDAVIFPKLAVMEFPALTEVVDDRAVPAVIVDTEDIEPGALKVEGIAIVIVLPDPVVEI